MNYISPCNHPDSSLSGSTIESMIDYTKELGLPYFASTDNGYLTGILRGYYYAKKKDVKFIAGVELYFKDNHCDICSNTLSEKIKYFKLPIHALDQEAYQKISKMLSEAHRPKIMVGDVQYPLFNWSDIEVLSEYKTTATSADVEDMVSKHLLVGEKDNSEKYYLKLKKLFGNRYFPSILPLYNSQYWNEVVNVKLNGQIYSIPANDRIETDASNRAKAVELTYRRTKHTKLKSVFINKIKYPVKPDFQEIEEVKSSNEFAKLEYDLQNEANKNILMLAKKNNDLDRVLINHYSYYAHKDDKVVQDMKLGDEYRIYQKQYIQTSKESFDYFNSVLKLPQTFFDKLVQNSYKWASLFDNFELKYDYQLVEPEGDPVELMMKTIEKQGRMKWDDPRYVKQFEEEKELLINNGVMNLIPYFLPIEDVFDYYAKNGELVGPARGSAGGFLISYLMGVTQIDPIKYELSSSRFLTLDRVQSGNFPDIDVDLESRDLLVGLDGNGGYLKEKYGNKAAQVSTRTLLRIKSAILDANRFVNGGKLEDSIQALSKSLPNTPQGISDSDFVFGYENNGAHIPGLIETNKDLQRYSEERPQEWDIVKKALSMSRQFSRHACFAAGTLVDSNGKVDFIDLAPEFADNKPITTWFSGIKDTVIVSMNNGVSIQCTPDHRFMVGEQEVEAQDLQGKYITYKPFENTSGNKFINSDMAFALGWFLNDGTYVKDKQGNERFEFYFTPYKDDQPKERVLNWLKKNGYKATQSKYREDSYRTYNLPSEFKITQNTPNKRLPKEFWEWDLRIQSNFMNGLFSANGYCLNNKPTVGINLVSKLLASDIAIWLNANGINTSCTYCKPRIKKFPNGEYLCKSRAKLNIPHFTNKIAFENLVGFTQDYKADRLREIIEKANNTSYTPNKIRCLYIEKAEKVPVWDFNEPLENVGYINGILVHNCAFILSSTDVEDTVPIMEVGGVKRVTQPEHKQCEAAG
jgi:DNA polymerase III alpha subunit